MIHHLGVAKREQDSAGRLVHGHKWTYVSGVTRRPHHSGYLISQHSTLKDPKG